MTGPSYVSDPTIHTLQQLLDELARGTLQLPRLQRDATWTDEQRLQVMQSICDGIPIGSVLVWRTHQTGLQVFRAIGPHVLKEPAQSTGGYRSYLMDGAHRFSTLFGFLRQLAPGTEAFSVDDHGQERSWRAGFDLATEEFVVLQRNEIPEPTWIAAPLLLDSLRLLQFQRTLPASVQRERWLQRSDALAETFRTYKLPVVPLVTDDLGVATRAFGRVNERGPLRAEVELTRALMWRDGFDLEERLAAAREELAEVGWESLEPEWIFAACKAAVGMSAMQVSPVEIGEQLLEKPALLEDATEGLGRVATWLAAHCGIESPRIVPYRMQAVLLSEVLRSKPMLDAAASTRMVRWFWRTTYADPPTDANADRMLQELQSAAAGEPELASDDRREPHLEVPGGFNPASVRVKAMALRLAALKPRDLDGGEIDASQQLADHGVSALLPISPSLRGCAGRLFLRHGSKLREALLGDATAVAPEVLHSHAITREAAKALAEKDYSRFVELRGAEIRRLEEAFYQSMQQSG